MHHLNVRSYLMTPAVDCDYPRPLPIQQLAHLLRLAAGVGAPPDNDDTEKGLGIVDLGNDNGQVRNCVLRKCGDVEHVEQVCLCMRKLVQLP
jgi:hypothetical protein